MVDKKILSIKETVEKAKDTGMSISEYTLRRAIKSGLIPHRKVGRTYLIAWENVENWLLCADSGRK